MKSIQRVSGTLSTVSSMKFLDDDGDHNNSETYIEIHDESSIMNVRTATVVTQNTTGTLSTSRYSSARDIDSLSTMSQDIAVKDRRRSFLKKKKRNPIPSLDSMGLSCVSSSFLERVNDEKQAQKDRRRMLSRINSEIFSMDQVDDICQDSVMKLRITENDTDQEDIKYLKKEDIKYLKNTHDSERHEKYHNFDTENNIIRRLYRRGEKEMHRSLSSSATVSSYREAKRKVFEDIEEFMQGHVEISAAEVLKGL